MFNNFSVCYGYEFEGIVLEVVKSGISSESRAHTIAHNLQQNDESADYFVVENA